MNQVKSYFSFIILVLVLCFFVHACNARRFAMTSCKKFPSDQVEGKLISNMNLRSPNIVNVNVNVMMHRRSAIDSSSNPCKQKNVIKGAKSGSENCNRSSLHKGMLNEDTSKGAKGPRHNRREKVLTSSIYKYEDFMETDYKPPHRESPIHNK